jgi:hypothetical protein
LTSGKIPASRKADNVQNQEAEVGYLPDLLMLIAKDVRSSQRRPGEMVIVIHPPYSHLREELGTAFKGQSEVDVIIDRRHGERRVTAEAVQTERRRVDRRSLKEKMVEVLIRV